MADPEQVTCPHCGQPYMVRPEQWSQYHGRTINCTKCGKPFVVTAPPEVRQPVQPPQWPAVPSAAPAQTPYPQPTYPPAGYAPVATPYGAPPYGAPPMYGYPAAMIHAPGPSGWAITSLITGLLSFCLPAVGSILAIVTGIIGINRSRDPRIGGRGLSIAGLVLGSITLVFVTPVVISMLVSGSYLFPGITAARQRADQVKCAANLRQIGSALQTYARSHDDRYPQQPADALQSDSSISSSLFICPEDAKVPASGATSQVADGINSGRNSSYIYVGAGLKLSDPSDEVVMYEPLSNHQRRGMNVLFVDGTVKFLDRNDAQQILDEQARNVRPIKATSRSSGSTP